MEPEADIAEGKQNKEEVYSYIEMWGCKKKC